MAKFEGRGACDCCKKGVDVYSDKGGLAYYNCGPCGVRVLHRNRRTSDALLARIDREAEQDDGPAPAPGAAPRAPAGPPAPPKKPGFLSNLSL